MRRSRSGFTLHLVLGAAMLVGLLAFSLQYYASFVNKQAHRLTHGDVATNLASSGLTLVVARLNQSFTRTAPVVPSLQAGAEIGWRPLVARSPKDLAAWLGAGAQDAGPLMERLVGPRWRDTLDAMEAAFPGSRVEVQLESEVLPLIEGSYLDPVEKRVKLTLTSTGRWQGVQRSVKAGIDLKVTHPAAPAVGKFTLFARKTSGDFNLFRNLKGGEPQEGQFPVVLENTPPAEETAGRDDAKLIERDAGPDEIRGALMRRGFVYLGGDRVELNLTDGTGTYGQFHQIHDPARFPDAQLKLDWTEPSPFFNTPDGATLSRGQRHADPSDQYDQYPGLEAVYFGYHDGLQEDRVLGDAVPDGRSSILQLFGDTKKKSRTVVYGDVWQRIPMHSRMRLVSVLRSSGETFDTLGAANDRSRAFPYCPDDEKYQEDLAREERGEAPQYLANIAQQFGITGVEPPFVLAPASYRHRAMFGDRWDPSATTSYAQLMSRVEKLRMNEIIDAMRYGDVFPPSKAAKTDPAWRSVLEGAPEDYLTVRNFKIQSQDPLHEMMDAPLSFQGDLEAFTADLEGKASPFEDLVRARVTRVLDSPDAFIDRYVVPTAEGPELVLHENVLIEQGDLILPPVWFKGRGMIVLQEGDFVSRGINHRVMHLPQFLSVVALQGSVRLAGQVMHQAQIVALRGELTIEGSAEVHVDGGLALGTLPASSLEKGGVLTFSPLTDPSQPYTPDFPHFVDLYQVWMAPLPFSIERSG